MAHSKTSFVSLLRTNLPLENPGASSLLSSCTSSVNIILLHQITHYLDQPSSPLILSQLELLSSYFMGINQILTFSKIISYIRHSLSAQIRLGSTIKGDPESGHLSPLPLTTVVPATIISRQFVHLPLDWVSCFHSSPLTRFPILFSTGQSGSLRSHLNPVLTVLWWFTLSFQVKANVWAVAYKASQISQPPPHPLCPLASVMFALFEPQWALYPSVTTGIYQTSGPLHLLSPLPTPCLPEIARWLMAAFPLHLLQLPFIMRAHQTI